MLTPDDLLAIEQAAIAIVAGGWKTKVGEFNKALQLLLATTSAADLPMVIDHLKFLLRQMTVTENMDAEALIAVQQAHDHGLKMFEQAMGTKPVKIPVSANSKKAVTGLNEIAVKGVEDSLANLDKEITSKTALINALSPVLSTPNKVEASTAWAVNNASNSAVAKLAKANKESMCWISERDGCVHCQAYNGVFNDGKDFPKNLTFAGKPLEQKGNLYHPPLHPRCRCQVEVGITQDYADALKREAVRSILRATKTSTESEKVRVEAAERLLAKNPDAPASVIKYSKKKIKEFEVKQAKKAKQ